MFYYLFENLTNLYSFLNIFQYITFRSFLAGLTSFLIVIFLTPRFIRILSERNFKENISIYLESSHKNKRGTPNMGGFLIGIGIITSCLIYGNLENSKFLLCLVCYIGFAASGFIDDFTKLKKGVGISLKNKLFIQLLICSILIILLLKNSDGFYYSSQIYDISHIGFPFTKKIFDMGFIYVIFCFFVIIGSANAVNLTDGLDGLATGSLITSIGAITVVAYLAGNIIYSSYLYIPYIENVGEITIFLSSMLGALLGFLWFNSNPAQIFMGDVGSIPLGGSIGFVSILIKQEILLLIIGGIFVLEALSVIIQVISFRFFGKRFFKIAPLHHHFEKNGVAESKIVIRFWIVSILLALFSIASLKIR